MVKLKHKQRKKIIREIFQLVARLAVESDNTVIDFSQPYNRSVHHRLGNEMHELTRLFDRLAPSNRWNGKDVLNILMGVLGIWDPLICNPQAKLFGAFHEGRQINQTRAAIENRGLIRNAIAEIAKGNSGVRSDLEHLLDKAQESSKSSKAYREFVWKENQLPHTARDVRPI